MPKEISLSGLLKMGSHTVRIADSISSTREPSGTQPGLQVQRGDLAVVAIEHRQEIFGEVVLVARIERADDAEIHGGVFGLRRIVDEHEDVARVHVGVEEVVAEHLREEDLHAVLRQLAGCRCRLRAARAMLEICTPRMRSITMTPGRQKSQCTAGTYRRGEFSKLRRSCEALPASRIRSSSSMMVFLVLARPLPRACSRWLPSQLRLREARQRAQHLEVARDDGVHAGPQHLDHHFAGLRAVRARTSARNSAACTCAMDAAASGVFVERREHLLRRRGHRRPR